MIEFVKHRDEYSDKVIYKAINPLSGNLVPWEYDKAIELLDKGEAKLVNLKDVKQE